MDKPPVNEQHQLLILAFNTAINSCKTDGEISDLFNILMQHLDMDMPLQKYHVVLRGISMCAKEERKFVNSMEPDDEIFTDAVSEFAKNILEQIDEYLQPLIELTK